MSKYTAILCCLFCICTYGQDNNSIQKQQAKELLEKQLQEKQKQMEEIKECLQKIEKMSEEEITPQMLKDYPDYIKSYLFTKAKKTILDQLEELNNKIREHEQRLRLIIGQWYPSVSRKAKANHTTFTIKLDKESYNTGPDYFEVTNNKEAVVIKKSGMYEVVASTLVFRNPKDQSTFYILITKNTGTKQSSVTYGHYEERESSAAGSENKAINWAGYLEEKDIVSIVIKHKRATDIAYHRGPHTRLRIRYIGR